jgi:hypothetical protein
MAEAIENQPFCASVTVDIDDDALAEAADDHGYVELTGRFMEVRMRIEYEGVVVDTEMVMEDGYPLMRLANVADAP